MDAIADDLLSMHMVQHLILILVCAPLFVLARPLPALVWALPHELRTSIGRTWHRQHWLARSWSAITQPVAAATLFSLVFLTWHMPPLYQAAIRNDGIHALEHMSFLGIGVIFWWAVIQPNRRHHRPVGSAVALLGVAMMEGSVLGALMTFSSSTWYPVYASLTAPGDSLRSKISSSLG